ncbi:MAG: dockerin type I repeat-containing protein [Oscillospiraceae bacterium]|nr:dockerin type I repeat-containing protein [Oscillospiraceae bacterium]
MTVTVTAGSPSYPKGDVDRSGQVENSDLIMVARHVVNILTLTGEQFTLGDMNDDKVIDNKDIITLAKKIVGM